MKKLLYSLLGAALLLPAALSAADFEGKVHMKLSSGKGDPLTMIQSIKGNKVRVEMEQAKNAGMGGMIMDLDKNEMIMLMDEQKMYMVMPTQDIQDAARAPSDAKLEKTGEKQKILGYNTEKYLMTSRDGTTELWVTSELGKFPGMAQPGGPGRGNSKMQAWERLMREQNLYPLRVSGADRNGRNPYTMEVTAVEKQSLSDNLFAPPADYQKMDMGGMMRGLIPKLPGLPGKR